jgi:hypothetical protein
MPGSPAPSVVPTVNGTVQLEWHTKIFDAEVELLEARRCDFFVRWAGGTSHEAEYVFDEAVQRIQELVRP